VALSQAFWGLGGHASVCLSIPRGPKHPMKTPPLLSNI
jgi:hypothetical protein